MLGIASSTSESNHDPQYYIRLDGTSNGIETNFPMHGTPIDFSASAWVNMASGNTRLPFQWANNGYGITGFSGDQTLFMYNSHSVSFCAFPTDWDDGNWHFLSIYLDKTNLSNVHIYFDGAEVGQTIISNNAAVREQDTATQFFKINDAYKGEIGFTGIHSGEITLAQHTELYNRGRNYDWRFNSGDYNISSNLLNFYMMGQGKGDGITTTENDYSGNPQVIGIIQDQIRPYAPNLDYTNLVHNGTFATSTDLGDIGSGCEPNIVNSNAGGDPDSVIQYDSGALQFDRNSMTDVLGVIFKDASGEDIMPQPNLMYRVKFEITQASTAMGFLAPERVSGTGSQLDEGGGTRQMNSLTTGERAMHWINRGTEVGIWTSISMPTNFEVSIDNVEIALVNNGHCARIYGGTTIASV